MSSVMLPFISFRVMLQTKINRSRRLELNDAAQICPVKQITHRSMRLELNLVTVYVIQICPVKQNT